MTQLGGPSNEADDRSRITELKARLTEDPDDEEARRELVENYRARRHLDQAGRYGIAIDGLPTVSELRAYGAMLRGIGADDDRMRVLSRLPEGTSISPQTRDALDGKTGGEGFLEYALPVVWMLVVFAILAALFVTFFSALSGSRDVHGVAVTCTLVVVICAGLASALTATWAAVRKSWRSFMIWGLIAATLLIVTFVLVLS
ncbi:hypothetical protein [Microbacterium sp. LWH3-1.2]|uniref:hypothetical protein n=1 Tax=Microbacterium sp. LWH3-1.2 TaxID=3135256 RepID=UPI00342CA0F9